MRQIGFGKEPEKWTSMLLARCDKRLCPCLLSGQQTWTASPFVSMTMLVFFWNWKSSTHYYGREYIRNKYSFDLTLSLDSQYFIAINYERNVCILPLETPNSWSDVMKVDGVITLSSNPVTTSMRKGQLSFQALCFQCRRESYTVTQSPNTLVLDSGLFRLQKYIHTNRQMCLIWRGSCVSWWRVYLLVK